jgi:hypothetical protein
VCASPTKVVRQLTPSSHTDADHRARGIQDTTNARTVKARRCSVHHAKAHATTVDHIHRSTQLCRVGLCVSS